VSFAEPVSSAGIPEAQLMTQVREAIAARLEVN
jgi:hypothetical protein